MRSRVKGYLFSDGDLGDSLRQHLAAAVDAVNRISEDRFKHQPDAEIAAEIVETYMVRPLSLMEQHKTMRQAEVKIDVSNDPRRYTSRPGPVLVHGVQVVVSIPFVGDPGLWTLTPSTWKSTFPRARIQAGGSDGGMLEIVIERPSDEDPGRIKEYLERQLSDIRFYIENQRNQILSEMTQLPTRVTYAVTQRRQRVAKNSSISDLLGIPSAPENPALPMRKPVPGTAPTKPAPGSNRDKWDVFLSHASEDKDIFARPLAEALRACGLTVWFDEFTLRVGDSLRRSIDKGLANSRFGVVVISPAFLQREWPQRELDGLVAREIAGEKVILPVWHNIDRHTVAKYSPTLADRLATHSSKGLATVVEELRAAIHAR